MAQPTPSARVTPVGGPLKTGFRTLIVNSRLPNLQIWEKEVEAIGYDNQEAIDITNMFNARWRTYAPNYLNMIPDIACTVNYNSASEGFIGSLTGLPSTITIMMPDNGTIAFFGYFKTWKPAKQKDKEQPNGELTITCTNYDYVNCIESGPIITCGSICEQYSFYQFSC